MYLILPNPAPKKKADSSPVFVIYSAHKKPKAKIVQHSQLQPRRFGVRIKTQRRKTAGQLRIEEGGVLHYEPAI
jgi:hypothetical protein